MFEVRTDTVDGVELVQIVNQQTGELVSIAPQFGGNVCELTLSNRRQTLSLLDGYAGRKGNDASVGNMSWDVPGRRPAG